MKHKLLTILLLLSLLAGERGARAQAVDPGFAAINLFQAGSVTAAAQQPDGKYVVSGNYSRINGVPSASTLVRFNTNGTLDQSFSDNVTTRSPIAALSVLANGQILAAAAASTLVLNGQTYFSVVKLNADGTLASGFSAGSAADGSIRVMAVQPDGKILLAGSFDNFSGRAAPRLVRLNTDGSVDQAFTAALGTGFIGDVYSVALESSGNILVAGTFTNFNGSGRRAFLRLLADGRLDTGYNPVMNMGSATAAAVAVDPATDQAVVCGLGGELSRLNADGSVDGSFSVSSPSYCIAFSSFNNQRLLVDNARRVILARGCVSGTATAVSNQYVTRYLPTGAVDTQFPGTGIANGAVNVLVRQANGQLLLGGNFTQFGGLTNASLVRVNDQAQADATFRPLLDAAGLVQRIVRQPDGKFLVGGSFREVNGQAATNLVRLNADGTPDATFGFPAVDGAVQSLALQPDGKIVVGGNFTTVAGTISMSVARLLPNGTYDPAFSSPATNRGAVPALVVQPDGAILVGANAGLTIGGRTAFLYRLLADGQPDAAYTQALGTGIAGSVLDIALLPDGRHYVGGFFTQANGTPVSGLVRLLPTGAFDPSFTLPAPGGNTRTVIKVLPTGNGQVLVGGAFANFAGAARTNLVRLNADGTADASLNANLAGSQLTTLYEQPNGKIIVGASGNHSVSGVNQGVLFRLNPDGSSDSSFGAGLGQIDGSIQSLLVQPDGKLLIGGSFNQVYGQARPSVARLVAPNVLHVANTRLQARTQAWPVPAHETLNLSLDAAARPQSVQLLDALGRAVLTRPVASPELTLPLQQLRAGVYLLRVDYADGSVTRRIVVE